jgi:hypothetical protein
VLFQKEINASDPEGDDFAFTLAAGAPQGAQLTTNGLFTWTPTCDQGGTSNLITVIATDNGSPVASSSMSFAIVVSDCVQIQIGSAIAQVGKTGTLPVTVFSSTGVTNLSFVLTYPTNRLDNWSVAVSNSAVGSSSMTRLDGARTMLQASAANGQSLQGSTVLGTLSFTALSGPSAFLPLTIANGSAIKSGNAALSSILANTNRVIVIGAEPLLESQHGIANVPQVTLYGNPGASYAIDSCTDLLTWKLSARIPMTNLYQTVPLHPVGPLTFYRAFEFSADPPLLDVNASMSNATVVLYGRNNTNYVVDAAINLVNPTWQTIAAFQLTNSFWFTNVTAMTNHQMFFRAKRP